MKTNVLVTMALVAGMMLAGCSKSESENMEAENNINYMTEQEIRDKLMPILVGTWVHDGDCRSEVKSIGADGFTATDSEYTFTEAEKDTLTFTADGKVTNAFPEDTDWDKSLIDRFGFKAGGILGMFGGSGIVLEGGGYTPPYNVGIVFIPAVHNGFRSGRFDIFFDSQRNRLYLHEDYPYKGGTSYIYRYRKIG